MTIPCSLVNSAHRVLSTYNPSVVHGRNKGSAGKRQEREMYIGYFRKLLIAASKLCGKKLNQFQTFICSKAKL